MLILPLQLVLFAVLLGSLVLGMGIWLGVHAYRRRSGSPNGTLAMVPHELPFGLAVVHQDGTLLQANAEAHRLLPTEVTAPARHVHDQPHPFTDILSHSTAARGVITNPISLRWWRYPLPNQHALLILLDHQEHQRVISRHHAFVGQLSHELRTPLTALIAHLEIAQNPATTEHVRAASFATLQQETHRMIRLVRDLLDLYRLETATETVFQPVNLTLIAEEAIAQVFPRIEARQLQLTLDAQTPLPLALGVPDQLKQVFLNLLDNAISYGRAGDSIKVSLKAAPAGIACAIVDSGPGIASADLPHVQKPLYRGRTTVDGSGIGLAVVSEILRRHQTQLTIDSSTELPQTGTTCAWVVPATLETVPA